MTEDKEEVGVEKEKNEIKKEDKVKCSDAQVIKSPDPMQNLLLMGCVCFVLGFFVADAANVNFFGGDSVGNMTLPNVTSTTISSSSSDTLTMLILNDKRCSTCDTTQLVMQLKQLFPAADVENMDYGSPEGAKLYSSLGLKYLPAVLFSESVTDAGSYGQIQDYLEVKGDYLSLKVGAVFDPTAEVCDNGIDDTGNGKVDCEDESCKTHPACMEINCMDGVDDDGDGLVDCDDPDCQNDWSCMSKLEKPTVELFVMSHCPFGTQIEKGMLPVVELLGDKIDFIVKFCTYAMHGKTELDEQLTQYCIQKDSNDKYIPYMKCFLESGKTAECLTEAGLVSEKLSVCISETDLAYKVTENFNDESTWLSGRFPLFDVHKEDNDKYGISGSPGLVINGVVARTGRDSASLLAAVCVGFEDKPEECGQQLSSTAPSPGFGFSGSGSDSTESCE